MEMEAEGTPHRMSVLVCERPRLRQQMDTPPTTGFLYSFGKSLYFLPEKWYMQGENVDWKKFFHYWEVVRS